MTTVVRSIRYMTIEGDSLSGLLPTLWDEEPTSGEPYLAVGVEMQLDDLNNPVAFLISSDDSHLQHCEQSPAEEEVE